MELRPFKPLTAQVIKPIKALYHEALDHDMIDHGPGRSEPHFRVALSGCMTWADLAVSLGSGDYPLLSLLASFAAASLPMC